MADNKRRIRFKSIAIIEAVMILILFIALICVALFRGKDDAVPANAKSDKPQVRRRAVIDKEEVSPANFPKINRKDKT